MVHRAFPVWGLMNKKWPDDPAISNIASVELKNPATPQSGHGC